MPTVQSFNHSMIEKSLRDSSLKFLRDSDGDFVVQFGYNDKRDCEVDCNLIIGGSQKTIYSIHATSSKHFERSDWGRIMMICNTWNKERRWPKSYLHIRNPSTDRTGAIILEAHIDLEKGIHQELMNDFTLTVIAGALQFWEWAHQEQGL